MNLRNYRVQAALLGIWILVVLALFRIISEKQTAALIAGAGFILLPLLILYFEFTGKKNKGHIAVILLFLLSSAIPIFLLRVLNWGVDFSTLSLGGIPARTLHGISNVTYLAMLASAALREWQERFRK